ncbi:hypothetical protein CF319_g8794 [Tilletia indica]|nr:hypothetical protein CF319_g8794 [Tilletia indica]
MSKIVSLSPVDQQGVPYRHYEGPVTRQDEASLQALLKNIWPGMPTVAIECRAKQDQTLEQILLVRMSTELAPESGSRNLAGFHSKFRGFPEPELKSW